MNTTLYDWGPNPEECLEEENEIEPEQPENDDDQENSSEEEKYSDIIEIITDAPTQEPCEREVIILNETYLEWTEEYAIPEVFYITNNYKELQIINIIDNNLLNKKNILSKISN